MKMNIWQRLYSQLWFIAYPLTLPLTAHYMSNDYRFGWYGVQYLRESWWRGVIGIIIVAMVFLVPRYKELLFILGVGMYIYGLIPWGRFLKVLEQISMKQEGHRTKQPTN